MIRYLTVHFYGAMLYFVGFYVLLLFDIVLCIQVENLTAITQNEATMAAYLQNSFFSAGYLMAASIVALKCLNLVPDLAAWMIPEGMPFWRRMVCLSSVRCLSKGILCWSVLRKRNGNA